MAGRHKAVYIDDDVFEHAVDSGINFSKWINKRYREEFLALESKIKQKKKTERDLKILNREIKLLKKYEAQTKRLQKIQMNKPLSEKELEFFRNFDINRLGSAEFVNAQMTSYKNKLGVFANKIQFLERIEKYKKQTEKCEHKFSIQEDFETKKKYLKCRKCGFIKDL